MLPTFHIILEKWKWNEDAQVFVSNRGRLRDKKRNNIKPRVNGKGYFLYITDDKTYFVHRLVAETWNPVEDMENLTVDHLDQNKRNNCVDNLEWCTAKENLRRAQENFVNTQETDTYCIDKIIAVTWCGVTMTIDQLINLTFQINSCGKTFEQHKQEILTKIRNDARKIYGHEVVYTTRGGVH